ncbi:MAG: OFA family MFS transporter [Desulfomonile tiedjei]|uniref:OFA family MFS transporter n=1 Tax=Desulfomonile tiedjei TaxID=2358 RepID=A0A9D6V2Q6_9BACT|nr:OFA family MFS transporter [Desulfomonile tiedjei]
MSTQVANVPARAWVVTLAGAACNLCLGILYAWSVWKKALVDKPKADLGELMTGINVGWPYLTDSQGTFAYFVCGLFFAFFMIPGGRLQDKYGPKVGATVGGLCLALGCIVAGLMKSYLGLMIGFGVLGGIGMGIGYAAPTPAALKWFGPHKRGVISGIVVAGYGAAAIYIAPMAQYLIDNYGISTSFIGLGIFFAVVVILAGQLLSNPPAGYVAPGPAITPSASGAPPKPATAPTGDWLPPEMMSRWQYYALVFLFIGSAQSGLLVIANAAPILGKTAGKLEFFAQNAWIIAAFGGAVNALGRVGTGMYSDKIGRSPAYMLNGVVSALCLLAAPLIIQMESVVLLFLAVGIAYWQYGGGLALMPAFTADYFGSKNLGANYGFVFIGWGLGFLMPLLAGYIKDYTGSYDHSFYISAAVLIVAVALCRIIKKPVREETVVVERKRAAAG